MKILRFDELSEEEKQRINLRGVSNLLTDTKVAMQYAHGSDYEELKEQAEEYKKMIAYIDGRNCREEEKTNV